MAKKKRVHNKQQAKIRAIKERSKKEEYLNSIDEGIVYICTQCGIKELIPEGVVAYFDIIDDGDINEPPTFNCEVCGAIMKPRKYDGVHGVTYEF